MAGKTKPSAEASEALVLAKEAKGAVVSHEEKCDIRYKNIDDNIAEIRKDNREHRKWLIGLAIMVITGFISTHLFVGG